MAPDRRCDPTRTLVLYDERFLKHDPGPEHPESPSRLESIARNLTALPPGVAVRSPRCHGATVEELCRVHTRAYVERVLAQDGRPGALDHETILSVGSVQAALLAAGASLELVDRLLDGSARNGFALVRPPGHHAEAGAGMGYCVFNNVALAAAHAIDEGLRRVLVIDWDVHHGNGTQAIFYDRSDVLYLSVHQAHLYPPSGDESETGRSGGLGYTLNVALPPGAGDEEYTRVMREVLAPAAARYSPELVLVSAGFDAHVDDPMSAECVTTEGFARLCRAAMDIAERSANGRVGLVLEGGYDLASLGASVRRCIEVLADAA